MSKVAWSVINLENYHCVNVFKIIMRKAVNAMSVRVFVKPVINMAVLHVIDKNW